MSWLLNLYKTYNANTDQVGMIEKKHNGQEYTLLPIAHTTQNAHIEVRVTEDGEFHSAELIPKSDANTLIPTTEASSSRAGAIVSPYPLHDKLNYVAGDFVRYGGIIKNEEPFRAYIFQLAEWAESKYAHPKVKSIYNYLKKETLIEDLSKDGKSIVLDASGKLISGWDKKFETLYSEKPLIFSTVTGGQESAFVRFTVHNPEKTMQNVWKDSDVYESFICYYKEKLGDEDFCFVTGEKAPATERHANKIRNSGDKAKLISGNDTNGFTFRGRFTKANEVASISYDASQKAHNALKWLINKQGKTIDNRVFLVWGNEHLNVPDPLEDSFSLASLRPTALEETKKTNTLHDYANEVSKAISGYRNDLSTKAAINIMVLDSATTGRLAVLYYREVDGNRYLDKLQNWHTSSAWTHRYRKNDEGEYVSFYGAPATKDIAFAAYGPRASDKLIKGLMERMLPCVLDGRSIPRDIVKSAFYRASNPTGMEKWEWEKTLSIACALINQKEGLSVSLEKENNDRDYLFGRMLAIADVFERNALGNEITRATNATRYMNTFSKHPERTWKVIQENLQPYQVRLGAKATYFTRQIDEIASRIGSEKFNNTPLSGKYLLGFYSQRHELYQKKETSQETAESAEKGE